MDGKRCIINFGRGKWYPRGQERLRASLVEMKFREVGDFLAFTDEEEIGSLPHAQAPYAFKMAAFNHAIRAGYDLIVWCDCSLWAIRQLGAMFDMLEERKYLLQANGWACGQWCTDKALEVLGVTRDEAMLIPDYTACCMGFDMRDECNKEFMRRLTELSVDGVSFPGAWNNKDKSVSADPRCMGHRHDQVVGSILAHQMGYELDPGHEPFISYYYDDMSKIKPSTFFLNQGM